MSGPSSDRSSTEQSSTGQSSTGQSSSEKSSTAQYCEAGYRAAAAWGIEPAGVSLLNQSENVVLRLDRHDDAPVVIRLHRPGYNTIDELASEVAWVQSLATAGIPVPSALPLVDGSGYYHSVEIAGTEQRHVGMVEWIEGAPLADELEATGTIGLERWRSLGELMARLRAYHRESVLPPQFTRRRWDAAGFVGDEPHWGRFWQVDALTPEQQAVLVAARDVLRDRLGSLSTGAERFGLIHADLHVGNVMVSPGDDAMTLIDFDDSGWGWWAHEIAVSLSRVADEPWYCDARAALLEGYGEVLVLDAAEVELVDLFLVVRACSTVGWLAARPELGLQHLLPDVIDDAVAACRTIL